MVPSHDSTSQMNNDVAAVAKIASKFFQIIGFNGELNTFDTDTTITASLPYEYISYQQRKKEVNQRAPILQLGQWNQYKCSKRNDEWGQHLRKWKITGNKKRYQEELRHLNKHQNQMRILLYTANYHQNIHINLKR